jgi:hypothetical protein
LIGIIVLAVLYYCGESDYFLKRNKSCGQKSCNEEVCCPSSSCCPASDCVNYATPCREPLPCGTLSRVPYPKRISLSHVQAFEDGLITFGSNYSTLAILLAPDYVPGRFMPMIDLRGHRFDNNTFASNIGLGARFIPMPDSCFCELLGFNVFWDWREGFKGPYNQLGVGLEILGRWWDFRANGYVPLGEISHRTKDEFNFPGDFFATNKEHEFASYGYNAEVGLYLIKTCNFFVYGAAGPYYLTRKCSVNRTGGRFRLRPQYKDYIAVEGIVSHDPVYDTVWQLQVIISLPLYQLSCRGDCSCCGMTNRQIYQPIERFEVMPLGKNSCWLTNF